MPHDIGDTRFSPQVYDSQKSSPEVVNRSASQFESQLSGTVFGTAQMDPPGRSQSSSEAVAAAELRKRNPQSLMPHRSEFFGRRNPEPSAVSNETLHAPPPDYGMFWRSEVHSTKAPDTVLPADSYEPAQRRTLQTPNFPLTFVPPLNHTTPLDHPLTISPVQKAPEPFQPREEHARRVPQPSHNSPSYKQIIAPLIERAANDASSSTSLTHLPGNALYIRSKADIDADGSPNAKSLDPSDGQTQTSLQYKGQSINAETVNYIVVPIANYRALAGSVALVRNRQTGEISGAIVADAGPRWGEISMHLASEIGLQSNPRRGGTKSPTIDYIVFPGTAAPSNRAPWSNAEANQIAMNEMRRIYESGQVNSPMGTVRP
jgi:hypothetical protein